ncbi:MAG: hypothetical protein KDB00_21280 [Planctomycetales bacterium]|nr:hypothetical protein [Planctomycetales bacterium]
MISQIKSIRIETGARLHFGLIDTVPPFGGIGVMIDQPATIVQITERDAFTVTPRYHERALAIARRFCVIAGRTELPNLAIHVLQAAPPHSGLGSGTQLSLAIAEGLCRFYDLELPAEAIAVQIADRGKRSAVGVHGYFGGGLIFESCDGNTDTQLNPIQRRVELPDQWRLVLLRPTVDASPVSGDEEAEKFSHLSSNSIDDNRLRIMITDTILPAGEAGDFASFADAIEAYNRASGMLFAQAQGGPYNGMVVTKLIEALKTHGARGVGQSSWGPGVFAWCEDETSAQTLAQIISSPSIEVQIAKVRDDGRRIHSC